MPGPVGFEKKAWHPQFSVGPPRKGIRSRKEPSVLGTERSDLILSPTAQEASDHVSERRWR